MKTNSDIISPITTLTTVPAPVALTGTINSDGTTVQGIGTNFRDELEEGEWIYDAAQAEMRQIKDISPSLEVIVLTEAFSVDLAAVALVGVPRSEFEELSIENVGAATGKVNNKDIKAGGIVEWKKNSRFRGQQGFIDAKVVDGTGTELQVAFLK